MTINGRMRIQRTVYWNQQAGTNVPLDRFLGIHTQRYSPGIREITCRVSTTANFRKAASDLARVGQIVLSHEMIRQLVEAEGQIVVRQQTTGQLAPDWTAEDCRVEGQDSTCVITGADGVMVPLVTETEKAKRRALRRHRGPKANRRRKRIRRGSDNEYKEFKLVAFYDPSHKHQYAVGTSGDCKVLGRRMRRVAGLIALDKADLAYSVSDGAPWIRKQYNQQLPMLEANILDYYHLRDHVIKTSHSVFGENTPEALAWRKEMMGVVMESGPLALLDGLGVLRRSLRSGSKRDALASLIMYIAPRVEMLRYPEFRAADYDIGSGPTEAFCKTLTARLKGQGMRWDKLNAEGMMALASIDSSGQWNSYWTAQRLAA
ncbi:MAG: UPF0236 family protein [Phycisphaerae bacterium]|jgi:hypothetical protein|nr:UPF0236 family protein [Phycisphaerae bacterium]